MIIQPNLQKLGVESISISQIDSSTPSEGFETNRLLPFAMYELCLVMRHQL